MWFGFWIIKCDLRLWIRKDYKKEGNIVIKWKKK